LVKGHGPEPTPSRSVGRPGCGPPISDQVFRQEAFGADWSKAKDLLAYNAKGSDGVYHIYTVKPDGANPAQLGMGAASFPQRTVGTPVWSPSGQFIAFVAEKSAHPGNSVSATPGWGSYSDLWVANADGSQAWQLTDVPTDKDHGTIIPEFSPDGRLLEWTERTKVPRVLNPGRFAGFWVIKVANFNVSQDGSPSLSDIRRVSPRRRRVQREWRILSRFLVAGVHQQLRNPQLVEKPDLPPRPHFRYHHSTDQRGQLQRTSPLHPGRPGAVDEQC
jgi:hypothetical protein